MLKSYAEGETNRHTHTRTLRLIDRSGPGADSVKFIFQFLWCKTNKSQPRILQTLHQRACYIATESNTMPYISLPLHAKVYPFK